MNEIAPELIHLYIIKMDENAMKLSIVSYKYCHIFSFIVLILSFPKVVNAQMVPVWEKMNLPSRMSSGYFLDVYFLPNDTQYGYICGFDGNILLTQDGGTTWIGVTIQGAPFLESIHFVDRMHGFTSGPDGIFKTADGGLTWREITDNSVNMSQIWGCYFIDKDNGLYIGGGCGGSPQVFVRTTDGGNSWTTFRGYEPESGLSDVIIYDKNGPGFAVSSGLLWQTFNGGITWSLLADIPGPRAWAEEITNRGRSFLLPYAGDDCSGGGRASGGANFTTDNGNTWREYRGSKAMFGSFLIDQRKGWICGDGGEVLYTSNAGDTWDKINCGFKGANIDDLYFVNDSLGWAVGQGVFKFSYKHLPDSIVNYAGASFCQGEVASLSIPPEYQDIEWNNGLGDARSVEVGQSGTYIVKAYNSLFCRTMTDTLNIEFKDPIDADLNLRSDSVYIFCKNESIQISINGDYSSAIWSDGDTNRTRTFDASMDGKDIIVEVMNDAGCKKTLKVPELIWFNPIPPKIQSLGKTVLCKNDSTVLSAESGYESYQWSNGKTGRTITINTPGTYAVKAIDSFGCETLSDSIVIIGIDLQNFLSSSFSGKSILEFDTTVLGSQACIDLVFKNTNGNADYILELPYILRNIEFSMPMSQFPIRIGPNDSLTLNICFTPNQIGIWRDTIVFRDTCSSLVFPLKGIAIPFDIDKLVNCDIPIQASIVSSQVQKTVQLMPNPVYDRLDIKLTNPIIELLSLKLIHGFSQSLDFDFSMQGESIKSIELPQDIPSGVYVPIVTTKLGAFQLKPIIIIR
jgi:photosystem II stability/assembly factor-like uncharacterized protein